VTARSGFWQPEVVRDKIPPAVTNAVNVSHEKFHTIIKTVKKSRFFRLEATR